MSLRFLFDIQGHCAEVMAKMLVLLCLFVGCQGQEVSVKLFISFKFQTKHELVHHNILCFLLCRLSLTILVMPSSTTNHRFMMLSTTFVLKAPSFQIISTLAISLIPLKVITKHVCPERMVDIADGWLELVKFVLILT